MIPHDGLQHVGVVAQHNVGPRVDQPFVETPQGGLGLVGQLRAGMDAHHDDVGSRLGLHPLQGGEDPARIAPGDVVGTLMRVKIVR